MQTVRSTEMAEPLGAHSMQRLSQEHSLYEKRLETLLAKRFPSEQEQMEEIQLKKWKLRLKDEIEQMRRQDRPAQHV